MGKRPYHHGDLEQALLAAALETIREDGVEALTLRGVGARVGVSRTALYRHFTDKAALLARVALEGFSLLKAELEAALASVDARGTKHLEELAVAYVDFAIRNPSHYRTMFGRAIGDWSNYPELITVGEATFNTLLSSVIAAQANGGVKPGDSLLVAQAMWSLVHGVAMLTIDGKLDKSTAPADPRRMSRYAAECLILGIGTEPLH